MDMFSRELAPISERAWSEIEAQAARTLRASLGARRFVDVKGPYGWEFSCVHEGTMGAFQKRGEVGYAIRKCIRLVETRVDFELDVLDLHNIERGHDMPDLTPVERAAKASADFEDRFVIEGMSEVGAKGLKGSSEIAPISLPTGDVESFLRGVRDAVIAFETVHSVNGPFTFVGGRSLRGVLDKVTSGRTWLEIAEKNTDVSGFVFTPSLDDSFIVSQRGGDFELTLGGDFTIGYTGREGSKLRFFIAESAAFRVIEPRAFAELKL